eukprot:4062026-Karenia_brevis.AAC.1
MVMMSEVLSSQFTHQQQRRPRFGSECLCPRSGSEDLVVYQARAWSASSAASASPAPASASASASA